MHPANAWFFLAVPAVMKRGLTTSSKDDEWWQPRIFKIRPLRPNQRWLLSVDWRYFSAVVTEQPGVCTENERPELDLLSPFQPCTPKEHLQKLPRVHSGFRQRGKRTMCRIRFTMCVAPASDHNVINLRVIGWIRILCEPWPRQADWLKYNSIQTTLKSRAKLWTLLFVDFTCSCLQKWQSKPVLL